MGLKTKAQTGLHIVAAVVEVEGLGRNHPRLRYHLLIDGLIGFDHPHLVGEEGCVEAVSHREAQGFDLSDAGLSK